MTLAFILLAGPEDPANFLCSKDEDYKRIVCDEVMKLMSKFGMWDPSTTGSPEYECHKAKISPASISTFVYQCTDRLFDRTRNASVPDFLEPPYYNGIFIGQSQKDPHLTYVYTHSTEEEIVGIFAMFTFGRDELVAAARKRESLVSGGHGR